MQDSSAPQVAPSPKKGDLLIVDDETLFLKIMEKIFQKHYNVKTGASGEEALEVLKSGFRPGVIISDQRMPGMTGSEFLEKSIKLVPNAIRVILTGYSNPKDIIACINEAHAYMYLTKPADEMALVQAVKICFDQYSSKIVQKKLFSQLNSKIDELNEIQSKTAAPKPADPTAMLKTIQAVLSISEDAERYYFNDHIAPVVAGIKQLCQELKVPPQNQDNILTAFHLHNMIMLTMPAKFYLVDLYDLDTDKEKQEFIDAYQHELIKMENIDAIEKPIQLLSQIWEHNDGSGLPHNLQAAQINREIQLVGISVFYFNNVYRLPYSKLRQLVSEGKVIQTKDETAQRNSEAIKTLYRRANWFDYDVFNLFVDIVKRHTCKELKMPTEHLYISSYENDAAVPIKIRTEDSSEADEEEIANYITVTIGGVEKQCREGSIHVDNLQEGMQLVHSVVTKKGMLVMKAATDVDQQVIQKLRTLANGGNIENRVNVYVPVAPAEETE